MVARTLVVIAAAAATALAQPARPPAVVVPAVSEPRIEPVRDPSRPALFLVGGPVDGASGPGENWSDYLTPFFEEGSLQVLDSRWSTVIPQLTNRDFLLAHVTQNDGDLSQRIRDARGTGARVVLLSEAAARKSAAQENVPHIDVPAVSPFSRDAAQAYAMTVVDGLRSLAGVGLARFLKPSAAVLAYKPESVSWAKGFEGQRRGDLGNGYYLNPIVAGDHPDPSILKDGDDYYMTFSSFDAYPGLVIWHSRDLVNWSPVGPTLFKNVGSVWAPDLVKHGSRYYIYFPGIAPYRSTYVIWADNIRGPWSDPVDLKNRRIDPGHAVGPDGRRYLFLSAGYLVELSADGLSIVGPERKIYDGWRYPDDWVVETFAQEGPKILKRGDYYYQLLAQGGTAGPATGHMIVAARSKTIAGPWEHSPYNPILRTQSAAERWWSKGHGTLVEGPDRRWWMVYHAYEQGFYTLGRQTLLEPIEWLDDGWFRSARYDPARPIPKPVPSSTGAHGAPYSDDFSTDRMGVQWSFYAGDASDRQRYRYENNQLVLTAKGATPADSSPLWFVTGDHAYEVEVEIDADPQATAGLVLFYNRRLYGGLGFSAKNLILHTHGLERPGAKPSQIGRRLHIRLRNDRQIVSMYYSVDGRTWERFDRRLDVSGYHHNVAHDFLSLRPALYAAGEGDVRFRNFTYRALP